ncbi:MAG: exonuclease III [Bacteroides sp.]|nr:exonuclease III [Bacteroides sp.]
MNGFTQRKLQEFAESYGHPYAILVKEPEPNGSISFPVAITSKYPIVNVQRVVDNMIHGLIIAEIEGYHFMVTHFHPFSAERRGYEIDMMLASAKSIAPQGKWLIMGDLNSVSPLDKEGYDNGLVLNHIREDMKKKPHNQNLINNELDYTVQQKVLDAGYVDAFKFYHPRFESSAPTKLFYDQSKYPLRYDYLYVSGNMKKDLVKCEIIKDKFTDVYSDHYPVVLFFKK